jgi:hypothetical protein
MFGIEGATALRLFFESQRDYVTKPKVGVSSAYLGENRGDEKQR